MQVGLSISMWRLDAAGHYDVFRRAEQSER